MSTNHEDFSKEIAQQLSILFSSYTPKELENLLFTVFNEATKEPGLEFEEIAKRSHVHEVLRDVLRLMDDNFEHTETLFKSTS